MRTGFGVVGVCVVAVVLSGCGKKADSGRSASPAPATGTSAPALGGAAAQTAGTPAPTGNAAPAPGTPSVPDYAKIAEQNRQTLAQMNQGKVVEAMSPATLKALLPADLPGMKRTDASAERNQAMGVDVSRAEGQYSPAEGGDSSIHITLTDAGSMSGPMRMGMTAWALAQYSRETDTGYEKTTTIDGYKAVEEYNNESKHGSLRVLVADRFIVEVEGDGVSMDTLKQALGKIDLKKLAAAGS